MLHHNRHNPIDPAEEGRQPRVDGFARPNDFFNRAGAGHDADSPITITRGDAPPMIGKAWKWRVVETAVEHLRRLSTPPDRR